MYKNLDKRIAKLYGDMEQTVKTYFPMIGKRVTEIPPELKATLQRYFSQKGSYRVERDRARSLVKKFMKTNAIELEDLEPLEVILADVHTLTPLQQFFDDAVPKVFVNIQREQFVFNEVNNHYAVNVNPDFIQENPTKEKFGCSMARVNASRILLVLLRSCSVENFNTNTVEIHVNTWI